MSASEYNMRPDGGKILGRTGAAAYGDRTVFWNVDTQYDFMRPNGKLPVGEGKGAEDIEENLEAVTEIARENSIRVVNTADYHDRDSAEFSSEPDFRETFPPHCIAETEGAEYVEATKPENPLEIDWRTEPNWGEVMSHEGDFIVYKDAFDVFSGKPESPYADELLDVLDPDRAVVYGVATDVCVNYAVEGLLERDIDVYVVENAVKGIDPESSEETLESWEKHGANTGSVRELNSYLEGDSI